MSESQQKPSLTDENSSKTDFKEHVSMLDNKVCSSVIGLIDTITNNISSLPQIIKTIVIKGKPSGYEKQTQTAAKKN